MRDRDFNQVSAACMQLYQNGLAALEQNDAASAIASFITALEIEPGFVGCRQELRRAQKKAAEKRCSFWNRIFDKGFFSPSLTKARVLLHFQPLQTIALAERILNHDPENIAAHKLLSKAAMAADLPGTAVLSLETLAAKQPGHRAIRLALAEGLAKCGDISAAVAIYGHLQKDSPKDKKVWRAVNNISAAHVPQQTPPLEISAGATKGSVPAHDWAIPQPQRETLATISADDASIKRLEPLIVHCPRNTKVLTTLAEAYARKMMFDKAMSFYKHALEIEGGKNAVIEKAIAETTLKKLDMELSRIESRGTAAASERERIQNERLVCEWHMMEATH